MNQLKNNNSNVVDERLLWSGQSKEKPSVKMQKICGEEPSGINHPAAHSHNNRRKEKSGRCPHTISSFSFL
jgi:hypothetical protein